MDRSVGGPRARVPAPTISDEPKKKKPGFPGFFTVW
jgi:hypothetical protein